MKEVRDEEDSYSTSEVEEEGVEQEENNRLECAEIGGIEEVQPLEEGESEEVLDLI